MPDHHSRNTPMLYIIQNDPDVPPGLITTELQGLGVEHVLLRLYQGEKLPDVTSVSAVMVLGGTMGANDDLLHPFLTDLKSFIRDVVARDIPYLGICLGGQLLAAAMGAEVASKAHGEKGTRTVDLTDDGRADGLFEGIPRVFTSFQWHDDSFSIPSGGVSLACSGACPNQAFRLRRNAWGLQFHPEVDASIVDNWSGASSPAALENLAAYHETEDDYCAVAHRMIENFVTLAGLRGGIC